MDDEVFRDVIGNFATGITIVTAADSGQQYGTTVSAVCSLSLEPPMLLVCLNRTSRTMAVVDRTRHFAVNILGVGQGELARAFATDRDDKFDDVEFDEGQFGVPLLRDAIAHIECTVRETATGGTHTVFFGEVQRAERFEGEPILYYRGQVGWPGSGQPS
ncbi:MAG TPA: flavin reductase family protein [Gaiellaceae bacterium]|nr:flavin reductase family protein [Gaiellaceae bacterium]